MLRRLGLSAAAIGGILGAALLLFGSPARPPIPTPLASTRPSSAVATPLLSPARPYLVASGGEVQGARLITDAFGWVRTGDGYRVTVDGGLIWQSAAWPDLSDRPVFTDGADAWVFGEVGGLFHTTDGGQTWASVAVPGGPYQDIGSPTFTDPSRGTLVGREVSSAGAVVLSTADGGANWTRHPIAWPSLGDVGSVEMFDAQHGLVLMASMLTPGGPTFDETSDGGRTWRPLGLPRPSALPRGLVAASQLWVGAPVRILEATEAVTWQVYADPAGVEPSWIAFFVTHDAGITWHQAGPIVPGGTVAILAASDWLVFSPTGLRAQSPDGGATWTTTLTSGLVTPMRWLDFPTDDGHGWAGVGVSSLMCEGLDACGPDGLQTTSNAGLTWHSLGP